MRFTVKHTGYGSERVGLMAGFNKPNVKIETPGVALLTQGASVVHLTAEVLSKVFTNPQLLWVSIANSAQLEPGLKVQGEGVAKFAGLPEHVTCATLHTVSQKIPLGHFESDKVPMWSKHGKSMITADRYMDLMEVFKPDMLLAIADSRTSLSESFKRINKAVERTRNMFDVCVRRHKTSENLQNSSLIGVIVGGGVPKKCNECIQHILKYKNDICGVSLAGITDGTEDPNEISCDILEEILKRVGEALPNDLLHIFEGCWNPVVVMSAIEHGWDLFDGSYPLKLTNAGLALALTLDIDRYSDEMCILDLNDIGYKEDFRPILEGCTCLACKNHTRAYVRHLLNTKEMLSSVLLSIHNLHHFDQLFLHARRHICSNTFQLYKRHITKQYEEYQSTIPPKVPEDLPTEKQSKKKTRVSEDTSNVVNSS